MINKNILRTLGEHHQTHSVSIYISAYRKSHSGNNRISLKNQIKEAEKQLTENGMKEKAVEQYLAPVKQLHEDTLFLTNLWDGLAIFLNNDTFEYYAIPDIEQDFTYVGNEFYLLPLLQPVKENKEYYVLTLSMHGVHLYHGDRFSIKKLEVEDYIPQKMEEALGWDYKNEIFQHKGANVGGGTVAQGHFKGYEEKKKEIEEFLRYVDSGLTKAIGHQGLPLIIAAVDYIHSYFKSITSYKNVWEEHISESPKNEHPHELRNEAWNIVSQSIIKQKTDAVKQYQDTKEKSDIPEEIIPHSIEGRIGMLFVQKYARLWGAYHKDRNEIEVHNTKQADDKELLNFAALQTFLHDGEVFLLDAEDMPQADRAIAAAYRF